MCIIVYKPMGEQFPKKETLKTCFTNNPDGAGYMYAYKDRVYIHKGFKTFNAFYDSLQKSRKAIGDIVPYVMHFRISTQAGVRPDCTHPFPLSKSMDDMRRLDVSCGIGIAHNGVISLTSHGYNKTITYSDTMEFVTDYLALIIKTRTYYKDADTLALIKKLCGSKLAILDGTGHCELIGAFEQSGGVWFSNSTYNTPKYTSYTGRYVRYYDSYGDYDYVKKPDGTWEWKLVDAKDKTKSYKKKFEYEKYYDRTSRCYIFPSGFCPYYVEGAKDYCRLCIDSETCGICDPTSAPSEKPKTDGDNGGGV